MELTSLNSQALDALVFHMKAMQPEQYGHTYSTKGNKGWADLSQALTQQGLGKKSADALISWANIQSVQNQKLPLRMRVLHPMEREFISLPAYNYLLELYAMGLLSMMQMEQVIEHCAFHPALPVTLIDLKKIILRLFSEHLQSQGLQSSH